MKNILMKKLFLILTISCLIFVTACNNKEKLSVGEISTTITNESAQKNSLDTTETEITDNVGNETKSSENSSDVTIAPVANKEISIYSMNDSTFQVEAAVALVSQNSEITPELIVDLVVDSLADRSVLVGIDEITTKDDAVIVSFLADQPPLVNVGASEEAAILDAIAQSLVDNLDQYTKVIFRVNGGPYVSKNFKYGIDKVYLDGKKAK